MDRRKREISKQFKKLNASQAKKVSATKAVLCKHNNGCQSPIRDGKTSSLLTRVAWDSNHGL